MSSKEKIVNLVESKKDFFVKVNDDVWATPELGFLEFESAKTLMNALEAQIQKEIVQLHQLSLSKMVKRLSVMLLSVRL